MAMVNKDFESFQSFFRIFVGMNEIDVYKSELIHLCESHHVSRLSVFGSYPNGTNKPDSDIDFLVKFKNFDLHNYFTNYLSLKEKLEAIFNRKIDLVEEQTLKNPILIRSINRSKSLVYG